MKHTYRPRPPPTCRPQARIQSSVPPQTQGTRPPHRKWWARGQLGGEPFLHVVTPKPGAGRFRQVQPEAPGGAPSHNPGGDTSAWELSAGPAERGRYHLRSCHSGWTQSQAQPARKGPANVVGGRLDRFRGAARPLCHAEALNFDRCGLKLWPRSHWQL